MTNIEKQIENATRLAKFVSAGAPDYSDLDDLAKAVLALCEAVKILQEELTYKQNK